MILFFDSIASFIFPVSCPINFVVSILSLFKDPCNCVVNKFTNGRVFTSLECNESFITVVSEDTKFCVLVSLLGIALTNALVIAVTKPLHH